MTTSDKRPRRTAKSPKTAKTSDSTNTSDTSKTSGAAKASAGTKMRDIVEAPGIANVSGIATSSGIATAPGLARTGNGGRSGRAAKTGGRAQDVANRPLKAISISVTSRHREDRHASIALAAYFRSESRGFAPGHEIEDWLAAEEEVDQRLLGEGRAS